MYCISLVEDDKSFADIPYIQRLTVNETWKQKPLEVKDFEENCCIIFDDTDTIRDKDIKKNIDNLKNQVLETGRHANVTALITSHLACKGNETKALLNESHIITIYLQSGSNYNYLLNKYLGLDSKQINKLKTMKSRFVSIVRGYPMIIYTEHEIMFLNDI